MQWRGQGILAVAVLAAAVAFGYQWKTMMDMQEQATYKEIEYGPYATLVSDFVEQHKRWPEPAEISFPRPTGIIKAVKLKANGQLLLTLSGWTILHGRSTMLIAPLLQTHSHLLPTKPMRLRYACVATTPAQLESILCMRIGVNHDGEINGKNTQAFIEWEKNEIAANQQLDEHNKALASASATSTQCDQLLVYARQKVIPCLRQIDETTAEKLDQRIEETFNGPRLRPEILVNNPDMLNEFDKRCDDNWDNLKALVNMQNPALASCF